MTSEAGNIVASRQSKPFLVDRMARSLFMSVGVLPFFLIAALVIFSLATPQFLHLTNLTNVARQSVYLVLVSLGQMLVLVTGGFDLAVGTSVALTSVISATAMVSLATALPKAAFLVIPLGTGAGLLAATAIGVLNGVGVARFGVSPFIMTLGVQSVGAGIALFITGGVPVDGIPPEFGDVLGFGAVLGVPVPVAVAIVAIIVIWGMMNRTRTRRSLLRRRRQHQGSQSLRHQHSRGPVLRVSDLRVARLGRRHPADRPRRQRRNQPRRNDRPRIDRRLCHRRRLAARRHRPRRKRGARRHLHRADPERHEPHADRLVHADGADRQPAHSRRRHRSGPLSVASRRPLISTTLNLWSPSHARCRPRLSHPARPTAGRRLDRSAQRRVRARRLAGDLDIGSHRNPLLSRAAHPADAGGAGIRHGRWMASRGGNFCALSDRRARRPASLRRHAGARGRPRLCGWSDGRLPSRHAAGDDGRRLARRARLGPQRAIDGRRHADRQRRPLCAGAALAWNGHRMGQASAVNRLHGLHRR